MKLYAIILFVVVLNFSFGFVGTMLPWFLPDAADELRDNFKMSSSVQDALNDFNTMFKEADDNWISAAITIGINGIKLFWEFFIGCITFLPELMEDVLTQLYSSVDDEDSIKGGENGTITAISFLKWLMEAGLIFLMGVSVIQLTTGKWLPFAE